MNDTQSYHYGGIMLGKVRCGHCNRLVFCYGLKTHNLVTHHNQEAKVKVTKRKINQ